MGIRSALFWLYHPLIFLAISFYDKVGRLQFAQFSIRAARYFLYFFFTIFRQVFGLQSRHDQYSIQNSLWSSIEILKAE